MTPLLRTGLLAGFACLCLWSLPLFAHTDPAVPEKVISVSGNAMASVEPDLLRIRFGVETQAAISRDAVAANAELLNAAIAALRKVGVQESQISTTQFSVQPVYDTIQDRASGQHSQVLTGYRVRNVLLIETADLDKATDILDSATMAGANRVDAVEFALAPDTLKSVQDGLIEAAVLDARSRAERALAPLEHEITGVQNMSLSGVAVPVQQRYADASMLEMSRASPTPMFSSDQDVSVSVHVTFFIDRRP